MQNLSSTLKSFAIGNNKTYDLETSTHEAVMTGLPDELEGHSFVHLSDFHCGYAGLEAVYDEAVRQVDEIEPDYIFFTGDYVDKRDGTSAYPIVELLSRFKAKRGVFACFGNHDERRGISLTRKYLEKAGIRVLYNESIQLESGLWVGAIDDYAEGKPDIAKTFENLPEDQTSIILSHNPRLIEKSEGKDLLILSGHTHGGQIAPHPVVAFLICYLHHRCWEVAGWYHIEKSHLYVTRGVGMTGKPYRINCPAEIGIFKMVCANSRSEKSLNSSNAKELLTR